MQGKQRKKRRRMRRQDVIRVDGPAEIKASRRVTLTIQELVGIDSRPPKR